MNLKAFSKLVAEHIMVKPDRDRMRTFHDVGDLPAKRGKPPSQLRKRRK